MGQLPRQLGLSVAVLLLVMVSGVLVAPLAARAVIACPAPGNTLYGGAQTPDDGNIGGIRAPVQSRRDGTTCNGTSPVPAGTADWIGIENGSLNDPGNKLVQIGLAHYYDPVVQSGEFASFYEIIDKDTSFTDAPNYYNIGGYSNDIFDYFRVNKIDGGPGSPNLYRLSDCGPSNPTYDNCGPPLDNNEQVFNSDFAIAAGENAFPLCTIQIMGNTGDTVNFGNSSADIQSQADFNGNWASRSLTSIGANGAPCFHEFGTVHGVNSTLVDSWDSQNGS